MNLLLDILLGTTLPVVIIAVAGSAIERRERKAARRGLTPIGAVKQGEKVSVMGAAIAREPLRTSSVLQRRCIGYRLVVDCHDGGLRSQRVLEVDAFDSFVVADATGQALVHPPFDIKLKSDTRSLGQSLPPVLLELLEREGIRTHGIQGETRTFEYFETVLTPGDAIIASGHATFEVDPGGRSSHRDPPVICHLKGTDEEWVAIAEPV